MVSKPVSLLIISDNAALREELNRYLALQAWTAVEAPGGETAFELAKRHQPVMILLDLDLRDGEMLAQRFKQDPMTCRIPIVLMTGPYGRAQRPEGWIADRLTKPIDAHIFLAKVHRILAREQRHQPYVLVVDDEPDLVEIMTTVLNQRGFLASGAVDGVQALEIIRSAEPDAVLLDLEMPRLNGWQVLEQLKAEPRFTHIPVVILTGVAKSPEERQHGLSLGVSEYLTKPCSPEDVIQAIQSALQRL